MRHFGILLKANVEGMGEFLRCIEGECKKKGVSLCFEEENAYGLEGVSLSEMEQRCELLIALGGDGTLIAALGKISSLPILSVNAGRLGFLSGVSAGNFLSFLPSLIKGDYQVRRHLMLSVSLGGRKIARALNEVLISKMTSPAMIEIEAWVDQKLFNSYRCDGLIVATPTGSTAYNISVGGSVVYPYCKNILLTPLAPHSLTQRPVILGDELSLGFEVKQDSQIIVDGQRVFNLSSGSRLDISYEGEDARLIYPKDYDYFLVLREKFGWGN